MKTPKQKTLDDIRKFYLESNRKFDKEMARRGLKISYDNLLVMEMFKTQRDYMRDWFLTKIKRVNEC